MAGGASAGEDCLPGLMIRYQTGEAEAVEALVSRLSPMLGRYLASPYMNASDTEDLLQDCWMRIHRARHTYRPDEPLLPWVFAIARHVRLDAWRRRRRRESRENLTASPPERPEPPRPAGSGVLQLLETLPESQREVLMMLKVSGMSVDEVARATSSTAGAVKQKAHRAYLKLRELMERNRSSR